MAAAHNNACSGNDGVCTGTCYGSYRNAGDGTGKNDCNTVYGGASRGNSGVAWAPSDDHLQQPEGKLSRMQDL